MLPQLPAIPLQSTSNSSDSTQNLNRLLPVGQNVSATVVAVSRDQIQPEIFRLKLEVNNRLIQMGVFQALPVGQKINVNRQSDGQIQIQVNPQPTTAGSSNRTEGANNTPLPQPPAQPASSGSTERNRPNLQLSLPAGNSASSAEKLPLEQRIQAAVISSRPVYPPQTGNSNAAPASSPAPAASTAPTVTTTPVTTTNTAAAQLQPSAPPTPPPPASGSANSNPAPAQASNPGIQSSTPPQPQPAPPAATTANSPASSGASIPAQPANTAANPPPANNPAIASATTNNRTEAAQNPINTAPPKVAPTPTDNSRAAGQSATAERLPTPPGTLPSHHRISLALPDGSKVELNSPRPLPQGTQVQLLRSNDQTVQVVRMQEPPLSPASALDKPGVQEIMRNALPNQIPAGNAFNQLAQIAGTDTAQATQIGSVVRSMLQLFGVSPGSQEAPQQIRQNVELGGLQTERSLSQNLRSNTLDMKSQLQQLQQLADKLPEEQKERFEQILRGIHSRVTSQQIGSLQQWREQPDGSFERVLQFDLPIKQGEHWENLELRLSREGGANAAGEIVSVWRVRLHFDLEEQGGVDAEIRLTDGHEISTLFWCEQPETADKLRQRSEEFSERLRQCGFNNTEVSWHQGNAPEQKQVIQKQLVDLHT
ncbi:flagellar hook-length control protein FliK [Neptuniibacter halophilus]|uniref:flagellar hook-length control protein FliK n=1 Tax=Neptuniibacter halophilus TaxID=651666 RepID=UPI0025748D06|nr:flagellar hook-length control protein FliK [Neptuniibacter halophilus]